MAECEGYSCGSAIEKNRGNTVAPVEFERKHPTRESYFWKISSRVHGWWFCKACHERFLAAMPFVIREDPW